MAASTSKATDTRADTSARAPKTEQPTDTPPADDTGATAPDGREPVVSDCVVNGGRGMHVGRAVNGKVCSYHALHYKADGTRR